MTTSKSIYFYVLMFFSLASYAQNRTIDSLQKVLRTQIDDSNKLNNLNELSVLFYLDRDMKNTMLCANEILRLAEKLSNLKGKGLAYKNLGNACLLETNYSEAFKYYTLGLKIMQKINERDGVALSYSMLAWVYYNQSKYPEALKNSLAALKIWEELKNFERLSTCYYETGLYHEVQSDYSQALKYYYLCLKYSDILGNEENLSLCYAAIGNINLLQGDEGEAQKNLQLALGILEQSGKEYGMAYINNCLGEIYLRKGNYTEALKKQLAALTIWKKYKYTNIDPWAIPYTYKDIGNIYKRQAELAISSIDKTKSQKWFSIALENYLQSFKGYSEVKDKSGIVGAYADIGNLYILLDSLNTAKEYLTNGLKFGKAMRDRENIKAVYLSLSILDSLKGNYNQAFEYYKMYIIYRDSIVNGESAKKSLTYKMQYESEKKDALAKVEQEKKDAIADAEIKRQKQNRNFSYTVIVLILIFGGYSFYRFRKQKKSEAKQTLLDERLRISRDLHDEIGSTLGSISVYSEVAKNRAAKNDNETEVLAKIGIASRELIDKMSDIVWSLNPQNETLEHLQNRMQSFAAMILTPHNIAYDFYFDEQLKTTELTSEQRKNIFLIFKEAVYNIVKYAEATEVKVKVKVKEKLLTLEVIDNGKGFDISNIQSYNGNGLKNMKARAKEIKAFFNVTSRVNEGTCVDLSFNL